jgi:hypothetical protein
MEIITFKSIGMSLEASSRSIFILWPFSKTVGDYPLAERPTELGGYLPPTFNYMVEGCYTTTQHFIT